MTESNFPGDDSRTGPDAGRDPRLAGFAESGCYERALPSSLVAGVLEDLADGTGRPPPEAADDEVIGMLGCWRALEAHAHGRMLAVIRELIRRRPLDGCPPACPGSLPARWDKGAAYEAAAGLGISWQSAADLLELAWQLEARLPRTGRLLDQGVLSPLKAKIVADEFGCLDDEKAAEAEARLMDKDPGAAEMTPGKLRKLCQRIGDTVDPEGAKRRREDAQREQARVSFFRRHGGDTAMFASGLPADDALMAQEGIQARALEYRNASLYPDERMDLLRVLAMLDLVNQVPLEDRVARYRAERGEDPPGADADPGPGTGPDTGPQGGPPDPGEPPDEEPPCGGLGRREPGLPSLVNLTLPLATLLGLADRPGEVPGYGSVDPGLVKDLARAAAASQRTRWCFTVTDEDGHAAGHACARLIRASGNSAKPGRAGPVPGSGWDLAPDPSRPGPDGGFGAWTLTVPGGARYRLDIHPVPLHDCDHRFATDAYRPGNLLRHLVEIRDGECVSVSCSHPSRLSDYEHGKPWHKGGVTDACNGSPVSRSCHQVKQGRGWSLGQPDEPGRHVWRTPSGRTYDKGPKSYPA